MAAKQIPSVDLAARALVHELDTEWVPDAWGFTCVGRSDAVRGGSTGHSLRVPFLKGRHREITVLSDSIRLRLQMVALRATLEAQQAFPAGVLPYQVNQGGSFVHYRDAAARRRQLEREGAHNAQSVLLTDISRYFPSVSVEVLIHAVQQAASAEVLQSLAVIHDINELHGYPLVEGYAACRALSNLVLLPVDRSIDCAFTRWIDDYRVFCASHDAATRARSQIERETARLGLSLSERKTRVIESSEFLTNEPELSVDPHDDLFEPDLWRPETFESMSPWARERRLRLLLRLGSEEPVHNPVALAWAVRDSLPPTALPRLAQALARTPWTDTSSKLLRHQWRLDDEFSEWRRMRLTYALWYAPTSVAEQSAEDLEALLLSSDTARPIVCRVVARHGLGLLTKHLGESLAMELSAAERDRGTPPPPIDSFL